MEESNYSIVIQVDSLEQRKKRSPVAGGNQTATQASGADNTNGNAVAAAKGFVAINSNVKPFVDKVITQRVSTVALRTGAQELEERLQFTYDVSQKIYGFASSVAVGARTGGAAGAILGAVMSLLTTTVDLAQRQQTLSLQHNVEDIGLRYMNVRAGGSVASFSGSRMKTQ